MTVAHMKWAFLLKSIPQEDERRVNRALKCFNLAHFFSAVRASSPSPGAARADEREARKA
jgi:hypothetical protein